MRSTPRGVAVALLTAATCVAGACSSDNPPEPSGRTGDVSATAASTSQPARPTLTDPKLQPPPQENGHTTEGRPKVVFDPCTWIDDETISQAGFDPASRHRRKDLVAEYTFLTCDFYSPLRTLQLNSGNVTFEEDQAKNSSWAKPVTVNGREAMWGSDPALRGTCEVHIRTKAGFVIVSVLLTLQGRTQSADPCERIIETASAIERSIGREN